MHRGNKGRDCKNTMKGNGINHKSNKRTKTLHWKDIAKGQCGVFKRVKAAYGHQIAVHMAHSPGIFAARKDKGRESIETTEIKKWNKIQKSTIGMVRNWTDQFHISSASFLLSVNRACVIANAASLIFVDCLPLSLRSLSLSL